ncbi:DUF11 domain-containing protein, partial [Flavobacterium sp. LC2016-23]|uniref:T9SS type B sorting domain-containing protein n=1 Tax=Flavobacterium sp. LC2016-23 TaxID=2666330 RepID=UPI0012AFBE12
SLKVGTCESPTRLAVTVTLSDPQTPTGAKTQEFCEDDHAKVSDLVTTESNVTWFDAPKDGKVIPATTALIHGTVYYGSLQSGSCESPVRLAVKVNIKNDSIEPAPNWSAASCVFDEVTYKIVAGMSDYNWLVSSEGTVIAGGQPTDDFVTVVWNTVGKATVNVDYINTTKCDPIVSVIFPLTINSCSDISIQNVVDNPLPGIGQNVVFTIKAENLRTHDFKEVVISETLPTGYEYVDSNVSSGTYNAMNGIWSMPVLKAKENQTLTITAKVKGTGDYLNVAYLKASNPKDFNEENNRAEASIKIQGVIVYNAVSANDDGLNDYFKIDGLEQFPNNTVEIFNSGGVQIFKTSQYGSNNNVFRGISEGRATINRKAGVPTGTYFYILRYEVDGTTIEKAGYLYVKK